MSDDDNDDDDDDGDDDDADRYDEECRTCGMMIFSLPCMFCLSLVLLHVFSPLPPPTPAAWTGRSPSAVPTSAPACLGNCLRSCTSCRRSLAPTWEPGRPARSAAPPPPRATAMQATARRSTASRAPPPPPAPPPSPSLPSDCFPNWQVHDALTCLINPREPPGPSFFFLLGSFFLFLLGREPSVPPPRTPHPPPSHQVLSD